MEDAEAGLRPVFAEPDVATRLFYGLVLAIYAAEYDDERLDPSHAAPDGTKRAAV